MSDDLVLYEVAAARRGPDAQPPRPAQRPEPRPDRRPDRRPSSAPATTPAARCVILTGAGPVLLRRHGPGRVAGIARTAAGRSTPVWDDALRLAELYDLIYTLPKPTIAAVNGAAVAGGAGLVTVCDLAVAVPEAKFGYPEVRRGLVAAMVHAAPAAPRRRADGPLPAADRRADRRRGGVPGRPGQRRGAAGAAAGTGRWPGRGRWPRAGRRPWRRRRSCLQPFSHQALSVEEAAQAQCRAAADGGVPAGAGGVLRQAARSLGAGCARPPPSPCNWGRRRR